MEYPSKYSNGKTVSAAQYIAEFICERLAKRQKKDLHYRFWLSQEWEKEYKGQIAAAHKWLKKYDSRVIIEALNSQAGSKIYSLRAPHLGDIIERVSKIVKDRPEPQAKVINRNLLDKGRVDNKNLNILDKLKEIDHGTTR
jgi:hypothetical protein